VKVKVCGVTRPEDAALAVELGADLLGINFWPGSPRGVTLDQARAVADAVRGRTLLAGVFVDQDPAFVAAAVVAVGLDLVQLHGDEGPAMLGQLTDAGVPPAGVIRAFRVGDGFDAAAALTPWEECWGFLFDAARQGMYGGTGSEWPWRRVRGVAPGRRALLAGGVAPGRLRSLLAAAGDRPDGGEAEAWRPWGIDVCSGVESAPGRKDPVKLRALFEEVGAHAGA
jgi:phosphoribosylanthranilate isomerase